MKHMLAGLVYMPDWATKKDTAWRPAIQIVREDDSCLIAPCSTQQQRGDFISLTDYFTECRFDRDGFLVLDQMRWVHHDHFIPRIDCPIGLRCRINRWMKEHTVCIPFA